MFGPTSSILYVIRNRNLRNLETQSSIRKGVLTKTNEIQSHLYDNVTQSFTQKDSAGKNQCLCFVFSYFLVPEVLGIY